MRLAERRARQLREHYQARGLLTCAAINRIVADSGLMVKRWPFEGRITEVLMGRYIGLKEGLDARNVRWLIPHALGHHLLHAGNQLHLDGIRVGQQERQAEEFAGWLHLADADLSKPVWELAEEYELPVERIANWLSMVRS